MSDEGSHNGKAKCAGGSCRALVPRKDAADVSSAWKNSISCTYFVPARKWSTFGKFFRKNGGDDETRTRDLCRDIKPHKTTRIVGWVVGWKIVSLASGTPHRKCIA